MMKRLLLAAAAALVLGAAPGAAGTASPSRIAFALEGRGPSGRPVPPPQNPEKHKNEKEDDNKTKKQVTNKTEQSQTIRNDPNKL